jgi:chlorobactene glucosyltransferase
VIWLIARAFQQRDLLQSLKPAEPPPAERAPKIAVIVPARDEAANIDRCLWSLVAQTYPASRLRIVAIDDHSRDRTFAIARTLAQTFPQLTVLQSPPLPPHWVGKSHACWIGARAVEEDADWLCFIDADVSAEPALIASAMAGASAEALDLLSLAPDRSCKVSPSGW